jgi:uncharacterized membrane protein YeaQ/YmgE (transglycosylase-associated protein family)
VAQRLGFKNARTISIETNLELDHEGFLPLGDERRLNVTLVGWIVFGLITGFVASRVVNQRGQGCVLNVVLGIVGACVGGFIFTNIGGAGITGFNVYSMFVAIVGASVVLIVYHAITGRRRLP